VAIPIEDDKARTQSPKKSRSLSKGKKDDKGKSMPKEEMAKTPCIYHARGKCRRGDECFYKHDDKAAAATKDTKRTNSPAPKKKGKDSNAAPCLMGPNPKLHALQRNSRG